MIAEDRVVQNNFLQKFDELVGEIGCHESLHGDGNVFGILGFWQRCLYYLPNKKDISYQQRGQVSVLVSTYMITWIWTFFSHTMYATEEITRFLVELRVYPEKAGYMSTHILPVSSCNPIWNLQILSHYNGCIFLTWSISCRLYSLSSFSTWAQRSGSLLFTRYLASLLNKEFSLQTLISS